MSFSRSRGPDSRSNWYQTFPDRLFRLPIFGGLIVHRAEPRAATVFAALFVLIIVSAPAGAQDITAPLSLPDFSTTNLFVGDPSVGLPSDEPEKITSYRIFQDGSYTDLAIKTVHQPTSRLHYSIPSRRVEPDLRERSLDPHRATVSAGCAYNLGTIENFSNISGDLFLPWQIGKSSNLFFQGHTVFENPSLWSADHERSRMDCSFGVGCRSLIGRSLLVGVNGFLDGGLLDDAWYWSPGFGFETDIKTADQNFIDLSLNFYRGGGIDLEAGYTFGLLDDHVDLRVMAAKYRFFDGEFILGWRTGVGLFSPDRTIGLTYEFSQDSRNPECHTIGLQASLSFRLGDLLSGKPAFWKPDPGTSVKRDLTNGLSHNVARMWRQPATVLASRETSQGRRWTTPGAVKFEADYANNVLSNSGIAGGWTKNEGVLSWLFLFPFRVVGAFSYVGLDYGYRYAFGPYQLDTAEKGLVDRQ